MSKTYLEMSLTMCALILEREDDWPIEKPIATTLQLTSFGLMTRSYCKMVSHNMAEIRGLDRAYNKPWDDLSKREEDVCDSLVQLIPRLPKLNELCYNFLSKIPRAILDNLHLYHPQCRLHIDTFDLSRFNRR
jgi:hypothetical protein